MMTRPSNVCETGYHRFASKGLAPVSVKGLKMCTKSWSVLRLRSDISATNGRRINSRQDLKRGVMLSTPVLELNSFRQSIALPVSGSVFCPCCWFGRCRSTTRSSLRWCCSRISTDVDVRLCERRFYEIDLLPTIKINPETGARRPGVVLPPPPSAPSAKDSKICKNVFVNI